MSSVLAAQAYGADYGGQRLVSLQHREPKKIHAGNCNISKHHRKALWRLVAQMFIVEDFVFSLL